MQIKFCSEAYFLGMMFFNEPEISDSEPQLKVPTGGIFTSWKIPSTSTGFELAKLGSRGEHVTPRPSRPTKQRI